MPSYPVEVFPPHCLSAPRHLEDLLRVADYEGRASAESTVPTPTLVGGVWQVEGLTGKVRLALDSDQLKEVIQKVLGELSIKSSENGSFLFTAHSNSLERAKAYGKSFGRVLGWNGFNLSVDALPED